MLVIYLKGGLTMERKIGEIFEHNGEWYQCVEGCNCGNCYFYYDGFNKCTYDLTGECDARHKYGGCNFIFKKLEKVGEPVTINGTLVQKMKTPVAIGCKQCVLNNNGCSIVYEKCFSNELYVSKQDQENMEEKKFNLKEFDIEVAKAGKPVCTRDGSKARIICFDKKCRAIEEEEFPIVAFPILRILKYLNMERIKSLWQNKQSAKQAFEAKTNGGAKKNKLQKIKYFFEKEYQTWDFCLFSPSLHKRFLSLIASQNKTTFVLVGHPKSLASTRGLEYLLRETHDKFEYKRMKDYITSNSHLNDEKSNELQ